MRAIQHVILPMVDGHVAFLAVHHDDYVASPASVLSLVVQFLNEVYRASGMMSRVIFQRTVISATIHTAAWDSLTGIGFEPHSHTYCHSPGGTGRGVFPSFCDISQILPREGGWDRSITPSIRRKSRVSSPAPSPPDPCQSRSPRPWIPRVFPVVLWRVSIHKKGSISSLWSPCREQSLFPAISAGFPGKRTGRLLCPRSAKKPEKRPLFRLKLTRNSSPRSPPVSRQNGSETAAETARKRAVRTHRKAAGKVLVLPGGLNA